MLWLLSAIGCAPPEDSCAPELAPGALEATVEGEPWTADDATVRPAGASLQVNASGGGGSALTLVLQTTVDGVPAGEATPPFVVDLGVGGGGWALHYPESGGSLSTQEGTGTAEVVSVEGGLSACFEGTLVDDDGGATLALSGQVAARPASE